MSRRKKILGLTVVMGLAAAVIIYWQRRTPADQHPNSETSETSTRLPSGTSQHPSFDKEKYSLTDPSSPWVVVNKQRPLPKGYTPAKLAVPDVHLRLAKTESSMQLESRAAAALEELHAAASTDGMKLVLSSAYRSESLQRQFYNNYVKRDGQAAADRYSARPGTSEHQTGFAADLTDATDKCHLTICFGSLPEGKWLAANAHKYGFVVRYPEDKEDITGYQYEPWHLRYVGKELSKELFEQKLTMEEFFGLVTE